MEYNFSKRIEELTKEHTDEFLEDMGEDYIATDSDLSEIKGEVIGSISEELAGVLFDHNNLPIKMDIAKRWENEGYSSVSVREDDFGGISLFRLMDGDYEGNEDCSTLEQAGIDEGNFEKIISDYFDELVTDEFDLYDFIYAYDSEIHCFGNDSYEVL